MPSYLPTYLTYLSLSFRIALLSPSLSLPLRRSPFSPVSARLVQTDSRPRAGCYLGRRPIQPGPSAVACLDESGTYETGNRVTAEPRDTQGRRGPVTRKEERRGVIKKRSSSAALDQTHALSLYLRGEHDRVARFIYHPFTHFTPQNSPPACSPKLFYSSSPTRRTA